MAIGRLDRDSGHRGERSPNPTSTLYLWGTGGPVSRNLLSVSCTVTPASRAPGLVLCLLVTRCFILAKSSAAWMPTAVPRAAFQLNFQATSLSPERSKSQCSYKGPRGTTMRHPLPHTLGRSC